MILVTGATGNVGRAVVRALLERGTPVRALVRRQDAALPDWVQRAVADLDDPGSVALNRGGQPFRGVFGSYVHDGKAVAHRLAADLGELDCSCWVV